MRIHLQVLIGLICAIIVGWHWYRWYGVAMAVAVYCWRP